MVPPRKKIPLKFQLPRLKKIQSQGGWKSVRAKTSIILLGTGKIKNSHEMAFMQKKKIPTLGDLWKIRTVISDERNIGLGENENIIYGRGGVTGINTG